ncbi:TPA: hypothetical protein RQL15_003714 [Vibrio vulnificus]|nr:hypothetical protein [Vibrio vulnificus]
MTERGLEILESIKAKHFPNGYRNHAQGGRDYRHSRKGQTEFKRAFQQRLQRLSESMK